MLINARTSRFIHRTLSPEYTIFVTLRRRQENRPASAWVQERWRAEQLDIEEETDGVGGAYLTLKTNKWILYKEDPNRKPPGVGDQIVEADGTVTELNSAVPIQHKLFRNYLFEVTGAVQGVN